MESYSRTSGHYKRAWFRWGCRVLSAAKGDLWPTWVEIGMLVGRAAVPCSDSWWVPTFRHWPLLCTLLISINFLKWNLWTFSLSPSKPRDKKVRTDINQPKYHILNSSYRNKNPWNQCGSFLLKSSNTFTNVTHLSSQHYLSTFHRHRIF